MEEMNSTETLKTARAPIVWHGHEYEHFEKNSEWFWALALIAITGAFTAIILNNVLFAIFILIISFVLALFAARKPQELEYAITQRGLRVNDHLYPFKSLDSFGIDEMSPNHIPKLIIKQKNTFSQEIIIPLEDVEADEVHDFLIRFLPEEDLEEPLTHKVMEWLGF
jgi:hypothetical protein